MLILPNLGSVIPSPMHLDKQTKQLTQQMYAQTIIHYKIDLLTVQESLARKSLK